MSSRFDYGAFFAGLLEGIPAGERMSYEEIRSAPGLPNVSRQTVKKQFREFIDQHPEFLSRITGFYPKPETIIRVVESKLGQIVESNLDEANHSCKELVTELTKPIVENFIRRGIEGDFNAETGLVTISLEGLTNFLVNEFSDFLRSAGNGLVSIAGSLNELLLIRAMKNGGMQEGHDFTPTGTDSEADIIVHSHVGTRENLGVEVKSYHARERLLRGLQDIKEPKIGVGFFKDETEFNPGRTQTLLQAGPAAIYMPASTLQRLPQESIQITTNARAAFGSRLYRPIERFVTDMRGFNGSGSLPPYP